MTPAELIEQHEGRVPWMYLDTSGKVTVGVGECLETAEEANLAFGCDVSAHFRRVSSMPRALPAAHYRYEDSPCLTEDQVDRLRDRSIQTAAGAVRSLVPNFDTLSENRKAVLISMAFNLGPKGLAGFRRTLALVNGERFAEAADAMLQSAWARQVPARARQSAVLMRSA